MAIPTAGLPETLQPQQIMSGASEIEQTGKMVSGAIGDVAGAALKTAQVVSNSRMLNQVNTFKDAVNNAHQSVLLNPTPQNIRTQQGIVNNAADQSKGIDVLEGDKQLLNKNIDAINQQFTMNATRALVKGNQKTQALDFQSGLPNAIGNVHALAAQGRPDLAQKTAEAILEQNKALIQNGSLPLKSLVKTQKALNTIVERANWLNKNGVSNATQMSYQKNIGTGFEVGEKIGGSALTNFKVNTQLQGQTLTDAKTLALKGVRPDGYITNNSVSLANAQYALNYWSGASQTLAKVQTGLPWQVMQNHINQLSISHVPLTSEQEGMRDKLSQINSTIKNNFPEYYTAMTNHGSDAQQEYNSSLSAIKSSAILSPQGRVNEANIAERQYYQGMIAYGQSMGIPAKYIRPFTVNDPHFKIVAGAFQPGQDVSAAVDLMRNSGNIGPYLSNSLASPLQQESSHLASIAPSVQGSSLIIRSNQTGLNLPSTLSNKGKVETDTNIYGQLLANPQVKQYLNFVGQIPNGVGRQANIQRALLHATKYCMATPNNDLSTCVSHIATNVVPSSDQYINGTSRGSSFQFLKNTLHMPLSNSDAQAVAQYAVDQTHEMMDAKAKLMGINQSQLDAQKLVNPLSVTNGPNGNIIVYDPQTGATQSFPLTQGMLTASREHYAATTGKTKEIIQAASSSSLPLEIALNFRKLLNTDNFKEVKSKVGQNLSEPMSLFNTYQDVENSMEKELL